MSNCFHDQEKRCSPVRVTPPAPSSYPLSALRLTRATPAFIACGAYPVRDNSGGTKSSVRVRVLRVSCREFQPHPRSRRCRLIFPSPSPFAVGVSHQCSIADGISIRRIESSTCCSDNTFLMIEVAALPVDSDLSSLITPCGSGVIAHDATIPAFPLQT